jgi:hypothetical protein
MIGVLGSMCLICFTVTLVPKFDQPKYRPARGIMFIVLGISTVFIWVINYIL